MPIRVWSPTGRDEDWVDGEIVGYPEFARQLIRPLYTERISKHVPDIVVEAHQMPGDYFAIGIPQFFSEPLKETVELFVVEAEFVPVTVRVAGTPYVEQPYYLANIFDRVECLDEINGRYTYRTIHGREREVEEIASLEIDESKAEGHHLFWVERVRLILCVSQELQDAIREKGFSGIGFRDPAKWNVLNYYC